MPVDPDWPDAPPRRYRDSDPANRPRSRPKRRPSKNTSDSSSRERDLIPLGRAQQSSAWAGPSATKSAFPLPQSRWASGHPYATPVPSSSRAVGNTRSSHHAPAPSVSSSYQRVRRPPAHTSGAQFLGKSPMARTMPQIRAEEASREEAKQRRSMRGFRGQPRMSAAMAASGSASASARRPAAVIASHPRGDGPRWYVGPGMKLMRSDAEGDSEQETRPRRPVINEGRIAGKFARKLEPQEPGFQKVNKTSSKKRSVSLDVSDTSDSTDGEERDSDDSEQSNSSPSPALLDGLSALPSAMSTYAMLQVQRHARREGLPVRFIPFQLRSLRKGFIHRCKQRSISVLPGAFPPRGVKVIWRTVDGVEFADEQSFSAKHGWTCPLCVLHGRFPNREMLRAHIEWDHDNVKSIWMRRGRGPTFRWALLLDIPELSTEKSSDSDSDHAQPVPDSPSPEPPSRPPSPFPVSAPGTSAIGMDVIDLSSGSSPPQPQISLPEADDRDQQVFRVPFGPATPLPLTVFSARPGGPRLFDLLPHPADPESNVGAGILTWEVIDREEEIFELDDVRDEDKVMHALWARWILLNRNAFISNYLKGTVSFIDTNWRMIYEAAGWGALRAWLLMMVVNRFLTGSQSVKMLVHYQNHVEAFLDSQERLNQDA